MDTNEEFYETVRRRVQEMQPQIAADVFVAENAVVTGEIAIGSESSIWYGCVLRGDVNNITVGARTNIQDGTVVHVSSTLQGTYIGDDVTIGHMALIHACTIEDGAFIGMQACIMDGAKVEKGAMVAAGALVTPGKIVPSGTLWGGSPARHMRDLTEEEKQGLTSSAAHYVRIARLYREKNTGSG
jgi:carbonic anhydrase/acetyltransferase-like protein (isoleucine patch superfamily)